MSISGLIDEASVTVDVSLLDGAAALWPLGLAALLTSLGSAVLLFQSVEPARLRLVLALLGASLFPGAAPVLLRLASTPLGLDALTPAWQRPVDVALLGTLAATLAVAVGCLGLWLTPGRRAALVAASVGLVAGVGAASRGLELRRDFARAVAEVGPIPNVRPFVTPPELHVGQHRVLSLVAEEAGARQGLFSSRVEFPTAARARWGLDTLQVGAQAPGVLTLPVHLARGLVAIDATVSVLVVADLGPDVLPLERGNRWVYEVIAGRGGATLQRAAAVRRGRGKLPPLPTLTLEVTDERVVDGLHQFVLTRTRGAEVSTVVLVRRDGALVNEHGEPMLTPGPDGACVLPFLPVDHCVCVERVASCRLIDGDTSETFLRLFLVVVTAGLSEVGGVGDLGAGAERGLLLTDWRVAGVEGTLRPARR